MALSLTSRPTVSGTGWNAAGNPIVYKFTSTSFSGLTNYRIEVECFRASDNTSLTGGVKFSYTPNAAGLTIADVSAVVKNFVSAEWSLPGGHNAADTEASILFYIKYQELYDGSATSVVNDSASLFAAVLGALQIGSANGGNMYDYVFGDETKLWLTKFQLSNALKSMVIWRDWPFTLSFIWNSNGINLSRLVKQYDAAGAELSSDSQALTLLVNKVNRLKVGTINAIAKRITVQIANTINLDNNTFTGSISPWINQGSGNSWTYLSNAALVSFDISSGSSKYLVEALDSVMPSGFVINGEIDIETTVDSDVDVVLWDGVSYQVVDTIPVVISSLQTYAFSGVASINATHFGFSAARTDGNNTPVGLSVSRVAFAVVPITSILDIEVRDVCDYNEDFLPIVGKNPIHLFWKNSLGGDAFWNFPLYHEYTYTYSNGRKAKRIILFQTDVDAVQWEALNELNTVGEVYYPVIQELTSSINATAKRVGQQVYMISKDGTKKTGVIVIPATDKVFSRDSAYKFSVEIELPEVFSI
jgi:hypothetical protein